MEISRLSNSDELIFINSRNENFNIESFTNILPFFNYHKDDNQRIIYTFNKDTRPSDEHFLDDFLELNSQRRAIFKIKEDENSDLAWLFFKKRVEENYKFNLGCTERESCNDVYRTIVQNSFYNNFKEGIINVGKQEYKLFKYLIKNTRLLPMHDIDNINSIKCSNNLYFCLSRNPIDYLFCSTNQNFSSCESLNSRDGGYYLGLGSLTLDPNRLIMFLTDGCIKEYTIKNNEFKHFKYISRSWGLIGADDKIAIVAYYPQKHISFKIILSKLNIRRVYNDVNGFTSKFYFYPPPYGEGISMIYLDKIGLYKGRDNKWVYCEENGYTGEQFSINCDEIFEELSISRFPGSSKCCCNCDSRLDEDNIRYNEHGDVFCETCYYETYAECCWCGMELELGNDSYKEMDNEYYCDNCVEKLDIIECEGCGESYKSKDMHKSFDGKFFICDDCIDDYIICKDCGMNIITYRTGIETKLIEFCDNCVERGITKTDAKR